jgi:acyl-CoA thioesterase FadM
MAVTSVLQVEFLKPVPIERNLMVRAWRDKYENNRWYNKAEMRLVTTDALLARANGVFVERDSSHFERHRNWLADQDRAAPDSS